MFKELIQKFNDAPLYYGIMFGPFLNMVGLFGCECLVSVQMPGTEKKQMLNIQTLFGIQKPKTTFAARITS